ncbi:MAG: hypothetical protein WCK60_02465 [Candidatus Nomurabacteria bacterium]
MPQNPMTPQRLMDLVLAVHDFAERAAAKRKLLDGQNSGRNSSTPTEIVFDVIVAKLFDHALRSPEIANAILGGVQLPN